MSYCVNCGVKLGQNARNCPLCGVEVINPNDPIDQSTAKRFPQKQDVYNTTFERNLWIKIVTIMLAIPMLLAVIINFMFGEGLNWSLYVVSSLVLVWTWLISPFLFNHNYVTLWFSIDAISLLGFLYLIQFLTASQDWFFSLALPIISTFTFLFLILVLLIRQKIIREMQIVACIFISLSIFFILTNIVINFRNMGKFKMDWALLIVIPFTAFALIATLLQKRRWIVEELKHWFRL